jgi:DNA/RNA-binding protein KIN17
VDETEKGLFIAWIDNSPKALAKQQAAASKERSTMSDEQRERLLIAEQIERAKEENGSDDDETKLRVEEGLKRDEVEGGKVVLSFSKPKASGSGSPLAESSKTPPSSGEENQAEISTSEITVSTSASQSTTTVAPATTPAVKVGFNAFKTSSSSALKPTGVNPLVKNVFKMGSVSKSNGASAASSSSSSKSTEKRKGPISAAEQLIAEDQQRKRRKMERDAVRA